MVSALNSVEEKGISNIKFDKYWQIQSSTNLTFFNICNVFMTDVRLKTFG